MGKKEEDEEEIILENPPKKHHFFKKFIIFIFIILLLLGGFKLYLYIGFVIGNDLAIKLSAEKNDITLIIGQTEELKFIIGREANPFCKTLCNSQLEDLSRGEKIENSFSLGTGNFEDVYTISSKDSKSGQDLYRYTINCKNIKDGLCSTSGDTAQRSIIITVEKEASLEELAKSNSIKEKLISQILSSHQFNFNIQNLKNNSNELSKTLPNIAEQISSLSEKTNTLNNKVNNSLSLWKSQSFSDLENYLTDNQYAINYLENDFNILFSFINTSSLKYNNLISKINLKINEINSLNGILLKNNSYESVISIINNFEKDIILFNSNKTLDEKEIIVNKINTYDFAKYSLEEHQDLEGTKLTKNYSYEKSIKFLFQKLSESITLPSPEKQCCFMGECISCGSKTPKYPILLIHGHGFSDKSSAENSLYIFDDLQNKLEEEGYIKAGEISLISQRRPNPGLLSIGGNSVSVKGSYYFDTFKDANNLIIVQSNSDSIDTYAIRLKGIIEDLMYETNQTKVVLITHSMGGLVARRYIQIFGENNVYKLIEVTVPNHGVKGKIKSLCNVFGANAECKDLSSDSLFINKLNSQSPLSIDVENIIAVGCDMEEGNGDGIVLNESAYLSWANNHYIQGSCNGLNFMHGEVLDTSKYPEVYEIIKNAL